MVSVESGTDIPAVDFRARVFAGICLFLLATLVFRLSPVDQASADPQYTVLLAETILSEGSLSMEHSFPPLTEPQRSMANPPAPSYQLLWRGGHLYYGYPPTTSFMIAPVVWVYNVADISARGSDGMANQAGEARIQRDLAAVISALFVLLVFWFASRTLSLAKAAACGLIIAFGTMVFSTTSRALWSDTSGIAAMMAAILFATTEQRRLWIRAAGTGSMLALAVLFKSTFITSLAVVMAWQMLRRRRDVIATMAIGVAWAAAFVAIHYRLTGALLPFYYARGSAMTLAVATSTIPVHLFSPSRGLFITTPSFIWVAVVALFAGRRFFDRRGIFAVSGIAAYLALYAFWPYWGGYCFGSRQMCGALPFLALCLVKAMEATPSAESPARSTFRWGSLAVLSIVGIFLNGRGATAEDTWKWNRVHHTERYYTPDFWNWGRMQPLWGLQRPSLPLAIDPLPPNSVIQSSDTAPLYFGMGWTPPQQDFRWTDRREAYVVWRDARPGLKELVLNAFTFHPDADAGRFSMIADWNGNEVATFERDRFTDEDFIISVPGPDANGVCELVLHFPKASSAMDLGLTTDGSILGIGLRTITVREMATK
ncbi:hypothetical protein BH09SUM1_BH09SUM1_19030 [soil metagenome]